MKLVLLGYMGSGKSSVGRVLGNALSFEFIDLDASIEASEGVTISQLFTTKGEIYFRKKEAQVLRTLISEKGKKIIALGGGTPCYGTVMEDLLAAEHVLTVYLKNSIESLTDRLFTEKEQRPLIAHLSSREVLQDFIRKHLFERSYYYNSAQLTIDCDGLSPEEIVEKILLKLF